MIKAEQFITELKWQTKRERAQRATFRNRNRLRVRKAIRRPEAISSRRIRSRRRNDRAGALLAFMGERNLPADYLFVDFWELAREGRYVLDYQVARGLAHLAQVVVAGFVYRDAERQDAG